MNEKGKTGGTAAPTAKELPAYERNFNREVAAEVKRIRAIVAGGSGIKILLRLRERNEEEKSPYENINQYPHKSLCIGAYKELIRKHKGLRWSWNPTNEGGLDISGKKGTRLIVAAECSTVSIPYPSLMKRIRKAIKNVRDSGAPYKYLYVVTEDTRKAAEASKKRLAANDVEVIPVRI
jgi:hypothetical protein